MFLVMLVLVMLLMAMLMSDVIASFARSSTAVVCGRGGGRVRPGSGSGEVFVFERAHRHRKPVRSQADAPSMGFDIWGQASRGFSWQWLSAVVSF